MLNGAYPLATGTDTNTDLAKGIDTAAAIKDIQDAVSADMQAAIQDI